MDEAERLNGERNLNNSVLSVFISNRGGHSISGLAGVNKFSSPKVTVLMIWLKVAADPNHRCSLLKAHQFTSTKKIASTRLETLYSYSWVIRAIIVAGQCKPAGKHKLLPKCQVTFKPGVQQTQNPGVWVKNVQKKERQKRAMWPQFTDGGPL